MDEIDKLVERLRKVEALFAGTDYEGEKRAAEQVRDALRARIQALQGAAPIEFRFTMGDLYSRRLLCAILRRNGIRPYRYKRQRYTTVMARVSSRVVDELIWPEFERASELLREHLSAVTDRVIQGAFDVEAAEAEAVDAPPALPG